MYCSETSCVVGKLCYYSFMTRKEGMEHGASLREEGEDAVRSFLLLLSKKRFDQALAIEGIPDEVFGRPEVMKAGRDAMVLALNIGEPEDAWNMKTAFHLDDEVLKDSEVIAALERKLEHYERGGYREGAQKLRERYGI